MAKEGHPDIVITDINMPEMDGLTASRELFKIYPDIGCIIMSSEKDITTVRTAMSIGVQEYLIKPFSIDELETAITNVKKRIVEMRQRLAQAAHLQNRSEIYLKQLAEEYARTRRTDDQALDVFEQLASNPDCELRWLRTLAMIYIIRQEWGKLQALAARLEQQIQRK
jgi:YesN/AraC family two-component response regulator